MQFFTLLVSLIAAVAATSTCSDNPAFRRFSFGGINGLIVSDGPAIFAENPFLVPDAVVRRTLRASFRTVSPLIGQQNVAIIDLPDARVMVDAGSVNIPELPQFRNAGRLISNMKAAGIEPESVDAVLFTHAHGDHVSGVTTVDGKAAFPNAMLYISRVDHEFWTQENVPNLKPEVIPNELIQGLKDIYLRTIKPYGGRVVLVEANGKPLRGVTFIPTPGHSPGHSAVRFQGKGEALFATGDSWITKADQLENPEWEFFIELDAVQAYKSRIKALSGAARRRDLVLSYHESFPGLGHVSVNGAAFSWTPAETEFMGTAVKTQC